MDTIKNIIIRALDIEEFPSDLQEGIIAKAGEGIAQSVMIHAFMTLPIVEQQVLMEKLDKDENMETIFSWLQTKLPDFQKIVADALARYVLV